MKLQTQRGSAHVIIIIVLVVALLGVLGFNFWQNFIHKTPSVPNSEVTTGTQIQKPVPDETKQVLVIKEEGILISVPAGNPQLSYKIDTTSGSKDLQIFAQTAISPNYPCQDKETGYFMSLVKNSKERLDQLGTDTSSGYTQVGDNYWSAALLGKCQDKFTNELIEQIVSGISSVN